MAVEIVLPTELARRDADGPREGLVVGVDAGGTKTLAAALDLASGVVTTGRAGPANPDAIPMQDALAAMVEAVREATGDRDDTRGVVIAGAGTDAGTIGAAVAGVLPAALFVNDVVAAWATVAGGKPGIAVISGTGSNSLGVDAQHRARRVGGWGHVFGDEGSGHWLGAEMVGAAIRAFDGRAPATALGDLLARELGVPDAGAAVMRLYAEGAGKTAVAALAPLVSRAADDGDPVATALLRTAGEDLAAHVQAIADALDLDAGGSLPVGLTGSTWKAGGALVDGFRAGVARRLPNAQIQRIETPPVIGSLALALHACGRSDAVDTLLSDAAERLRDA